MPYSLQARTRLAAAGPRCSAVSPPVRPDARGQDASVLVQGYHQAVVKAGFAACVLQFDVLEAVATADGITASTAAQPVDSSIASADLSM